MPRLFKNEDSLPEEVKSSLRKYESGQRLLSILNTDGYLEVLAVLREDVEVAKKTLERYRDSDAQYALRLLAELQGKQKALTHLEQTVKSRTELVETPPSEIQKYIT